MEKELFKDIKDSKKRLSLLIDNCDKVEEKGYMKRYTPEELAEMKDGLSEVAIAINDIEEERREIAKEFKEQLKPAKEEKKRLLAGLKNKAEYVRENCYKFVNTETREVGYYNEEGDLIDVRSAGADELQGNIFQINRKVN